MTQDLKYFAEGHEDNPEKHYAVDANMRFMVNETPELKAHRDWVESNIFGFGERSFHWLHKLLVDEMPKAFTFMEIGVFRGQVLSLYKLLADLQGKKASRYGITPLDGTDGHWDSNYTEDIKTIHKQFKLKQDYKILHGLSTDPEIVKQAQEIPVDILYIDGGHTKEVVDSDLRNYPQLVKQGGYLVIDDACNNMNMPFGFFQGIEPVTRAVLEWEKTESGKGFEFLFNVVHNKVYRKL